MKTKYRSNRDGQQSNIIFKLDKVMCEKGFNKNQLMNATNFQYDTIQNYYAGRITRVDLFVLSELCRVLECEVGDIIEYVPDK